ncbi:MAG: hypothetical protein FWF36_10250 [Propionibacteriaceae bacterium]|nr:hypothetical protein [Propionibacteriaceae bacterium]
MMICPRCGTVYPNNMLYCPGDGTALMRQADGPSSAPVPGSTAPAYWPTPPPKPRRQGGLIALVLGIVLVVVVAAGAWLIVTGRLGDVVTPPMTTHIPTTTTTTAPKPTDWTRGVKQTWQQNIGDATNGWGYGYIPWLLSDQAWVVGDMTSLTGIDPSTGQIMWHLEDAQYGWYLCAHALVGGQLACLEAEQATDNPPWRACLIDPPTGEQQCLDLDGVVSLKPGWSVWWTAITTGDGSVFVQGGTTAEAYADGIWSAALRIDVDPLQVQWVKVFEPGACGPDTSYTAGALDSGDALGVTGNVFWYRGTWQGDVGSSPFALDIRTG